MSDDAQEIEIKEQEKARLGAILESAHQRVGTFAEEYKISGKCASPAHITALEELEEAIGKFLKFVKNNG